MASLTPFLGFLIVVFPLWRICKRAGLNPALSLLTVVPVIGLTIVMGILAFTPWRGLNDQSSSTEGR